MSQIKESKELGMCLIGYSRKSKDVKIRCHDVQGRVPKGSLPPAVKSASWNSRPHGAGTLASLASSTSARHGDAWSKDEQSTA
jgi:hypothetical protein